MLSEENIHDIGVDKTQKAHNHKEKKIGPQNKALLLPKVTTKKIHRQATNGGKMLQYINLTKDWHAYIKDSKHFVMRQAA